MYEARKALRKIDELLVVEGYMDVVAGTNGIVNAVATLGTPARHFRKLYRWPTGWCVVLTATSRTQCRLAGLGECAAGVE